MNRFDLKITFSHSLNDLNVTDITTLLDIHITNLSNRKNVYSKNLIKIDEKYINLEIILTESIFCQIFIFY